MGSFQFLQAGECGWIMTDLSYQTSLATYTTAVTTLAMARTTYALSVTAHTEAVTEAARLKLDCECATQSAHTVAWADANADNDINAAAWAQAHHIDCVVDHIDEADCSFGPAPGLTQPTLCDDIESVSCAAESGSAAPVAPETAAPETACDAHDAAVSFVDGCGMSSTTWTSTGSQDGITMNIDGLSMGSAGVFFNAPRGRSVNYNIGPDAHAQLSIEIWFKETASTSSLGWIIGHDNGGYDRAINIHDHRFGGVAAPPGRTYSSTLGYPSLNQWYHVVATYNQGQSSGNTVFMRQLGGALQSQALPVTRNNGGGLTSFDVGGLTSYGNHHVHADIAVVRVFE